MSYAGILPGCGAEITSANLDVYRQDLRGMSSFT
jgi:hypothetical protein